MKSRPGRVSRVNPYVHAGRVSFQTFIGNALLTLPTLPAGPPGWGYIENAALSTPSTVIKAIFTDEPS
jgi:hypothetical protein